MIQLKMKKGNNVKTKINNGKYQNWDLYFQIINALFLTKAMLHAER